MNPLDLPPHQALNELLAFSRRLADGVDRLGRMPPVDVAPTPREAVHREDKLVLYRYRPRHASPHPVPLLIVYALVNRPYMLDLQPDRSLIRGLLDQGIDVYLIDWGYPDDADRWLGLEDYVQGYLDRCVEVICRDHDLASLNLLGVCQGGTLSLCYTALQPQRVRNLITMVTPVDFHTPDNRLTALVRHLDVDLLTDTLGNVPGELLNFTFLSLNPFRLTGRKYVDLLDSLEDEAALRNFLRMEQWIFDSPDQAGQAFRQFVKGCYQDNGLIAGTLRIGNRPVDLGRITQPVLNVYATQDHLVPPSASRPLERYCASRDYSELAFPSGHIGIYVSQRAQHRIPAGIADWLRRHD